MLFLKAELGIESESPLSNDSCFLVSKNTQLRKAMPITIAIMKEAMIAKSSLVELLESLPEAARKKRTCEGATRDNAG